MNKKETANQIKAIYKEWRNTYDRMAEKSRLEEINRRPPEAMIPKTGMIYGKNNQDAFSNVTLEYKQRARAALADLRAEVEKAKTAAPSEEALRAVQAFQLRDPKGMTPDAYAQETQELINRYGENYMINQALHDMAAKEHVRVTSHPLAAEVDAFESVDNLIDQTINSFELNRNGAPSAGQDAIFGFCVDTALGLDPEGTQA